MVENLLMLTRFHSKKYPKKGLWKAHIYMSALVNYIDHEMAVLVHCLAFMPAKSCERGKNHDSSQAYCSPTSLSFYLVIFFWLSCIFSVFIYFCQQLQCVCWLQAGSLQQATWMFSNVQLYQAITSPHLLLLSAQVSCLALHCKSLYFPPEQ